MGGNIFYWLAGRGGLGLLLHMRVGMGTFSHGLSVCSRLLHTLRRLTPSPSLLLHTTLQWILVCLLLPYSSGFSAWSHRPSLPLLIALPAFPSWFMLGFECLLRSGFPKVSGCFSLRGLGQRYLGVWDLVFIWSRSILRWGCLSRLPVPILMLLCFWPLRCTLLPMISWTSSSASIHNYI